MLCGCLRLSILPRQTDPAERCVGVDTSRLLQGHHTLEWKVTRGWAPDSFTFLPDYNIIGCLIFAPASPLTHGVQNVLNLNPEVFLTENESRKHTEHQASHIVTEQQ